MRLIDADKIVYSWRIDANGQEHDGVTLESIINKMPTIEPEWKKGKWIGKEQFANSPEFYSWQCSVCGCVLEDPTLGKPYPFCPNCGSFNGGEQE